MGRSSSMVKFLYTVLACVIGALNSGALIMDGHKYGYSFVQGMIVAALARVAITFFIED